MVLTIDDYLKMNASQKKNVLRRDIQMLLDSHLANTNDDISITIDDDFLNKSVSDVSMKDIFYAFGKMILPMSNNIKQLLESNKNLELQFEASETRINLLEEDVRVK